MKPGRALVIAPRLPEFDRESGLLRVSHMIDMLRRRGWEVTFGCLRTPTDPERYARDLEQRGVEVHAPLESSTRSATWTDSTSRSSPSGTSPSAFCPSCVRRRPRRGWSSTRSTSISCARCASRLRVRRRVRSGAARGRARPVSWSGSSTRTPPPMPFSPSPRRRRHLINDLAGRPDLALTLPDTEELPRSPVPAARAARDPLPRQLPARAQPGRRLLSVRGDRPAPRSVAARRARDLDRRHGGGGAGARSGRRAPQS